MYNEIVLKNVRVASIDVLTRLLSAQGRVEAVRLDTHGTPDAAFDIVLPIYVDGGCSCATTELGLVISYGHSGRSRVTTFTLAAGNMLSVSVVDREEV